MQVNNILIRYVQQYKTRPDIKMHVIFTLVFGFKKFKFKSLLSLSTWNDVCGKWTNLRGTQRLWYSKSFNPSSFATLIRDCKGIYSFTKRLL